MIENENFESLANRQEAQDSHIGSKCMDEQKHLESHLGVKPNPKPWNNPISFVQWNGLVIRTTM